MFNRIIRGNKFEEHFSVINSSRHGQGLSAKKAIAKGSKFAYHQHLLLINDSDCPDFVHNLFAPFRPRDWSEYRKRSEEQANCRQYPYDGKIAIEILKPIPAGQEIFRSYGIRWEFEALVNTCIFLARLHKTGNDLSLAKDKILSLGKEIAQWFIAKRNCRNAEDALVVGTYKYYQEDFCQQLAQKGLASSLSSSEVYHQLWPRLEDNYHNYINTIKKFGGDYQ